MSETNPHIFTLLHHCASHYPIKIECCEKWCKHPIEPALVTFRNCAQWTLGRAFKFRINKAYQQAN